MQPKPHDTTNPSSNGQHTGRAQEEVYQATMSSWIVGSTIEQHLNHRSWAIQERRWDLCLHEVIAVLKKRNDTVTNLPSEKNHSCTNYWSTHNPCLYTHEHAIPIQKDGSHHGQKDDEAKGNTVRPQLPHGGDPKGSPKQGWSPQSLPSSLNYMVVVHF